MVDAGILKVIDAALKQNLKDQELIDDIEEVGQIVEKNLIILTSFEKYIKEINTDMLEWGPIHSEKFWKENVKRFEEQDFHYIKKLISLLESENEKNVAIACYDLGEFARYHPFGKKLLESFKGKEVIAQKARSSLAQVREHALVAL